MNWSPRIRNAIKWGSIAIMHVKLGPLEIKMVENHYYFSYGGPCGNVAYIFKWGSAGLISVNLGVLGMKRFENPCSKLYSRFCLLKIIRVNKDLPWVPVFSLMS